MNQLEAAKELLIRRVVRRTPERLEVLDILYGIDEYTSADDIWIILRNSGSMVSRATVYSSLKKFVECGIATTHTVQCLTDNKKLRFPVQFRKVDNLKVEVI